MNVPLFKTKPGARPKNVSLKFVIAVAFVEYNMELCTVHWKQKWQKNVPQVWSTPSFKALKKLNLFDLR